MITVHHLNNSRPQRILWLLEELEVPYEVKKYERDAELRPPGDSPERLRYRHWLFFAEGSAMPPLLVSIIFQKMLDAKKPFFIEPIVKGIVVQVRKAYIDPNMTANLDFMESELAEHSWFSEAQFSAAYKRAIERGGTSAYGS